MCGVDKPGSMVRFSFFGLCVFACFLLGITACVPTGTSGRGSGAPAAPGKALGAYQAAPQDATGRRVALLIGNGSYSSAPLRNPVYDAQDMAQALRSVGFTVILETDADKRTMVAAQPSGAPTPSPPAGRTFTNSLGQKFVLIPAGTFMMGSKFTPEQTATQDHGKAGKAEWYKDEHPRHRVTLSRPYYMLTTEVTVGQFRRFVRETGYRTEAETGDGAYIWTGGVFEKKSGYYWDNPGFPQTDSHPVTCVSWNDAQEFIRWLNKKEGTSKYRLPTEAEWEYAARAGTSTARYWGDSDNEICKYANGADASYHRKYSADEWCYSHCDDGFVYTAPAGQFKANQYGLYDMMGNVFEWCQDWKGDYPSSAATDPQGPSSGSNRVCRGGGWGSGAWHGRSANRDGGKPGQRQNYLGFRFARTN